jgi:hypothetical protein
VELANRTSLVTRRHPARQRAELGGVRQPWLRIRPALYVRPTDQTRPRSVENMSLLYEALSRARMRRPQIVRSEATNDQSRGACASRWSPAAGRPARGPTTGTDPLVHNHERRRGHLAAASAFIRPPA